MTDTKMLQAIASSVSLIRSDIKSLDEKLTKRIDDLDEKLTDRLDSQGASLAYLEDDAPTIKDFNNLKIARLCV
jgi:hypothetical protein